MERLPNPRQLVIQYGQQRARVFEEGAHGARAEVAIDAEFVRRRLHDGAAFHRSFSVTAFAAMRGVGGWPAHFEPTSVPSSGNRSEPLSDASRSQHPSTSNPPFGPADIRHPQLTLQLQPGVPGRPVQAGQAGLANAVTGHSVLPSLPAAPSHPVTGHHALPDSHWPDMTFPAAGRRHTSVTQGVKGVHTGCGKVQGATEWWYAFCCAHQRHGCPAVGVLSKPRGKDQLTIHFSHDCLHGRDSGRVGQCRGVEAADIADAMAACRATPATWVQRTVDHPPEQHMDSTLGGRQGVVAPPRIADTAEARGVPAVRGQVRPEAGDGLILHRWHGTTELADAAELCLRVRGDLETFMARILKRNHEISKGKYLVDRETDQRELIKEIVAAQELLRRVNAAEHEAKRRPDLPGGPGSGPGPSRAVPLGRTGEDGAVKVEDPAPGRVRAVVPGRSMHGRGALLSLLQCMAPGCSTVRRKGGLCLFCEGCCCYLSCSTHTAFKRRRAQLAGTAAPSAPGTATGAEAEAEAGTEAGEGASGRVTGAESGEARRLGAGAGTVSGVEVKAEAQAGAQPRLGPGLGADASAARTAAVAEEGTGAGTRAGTVAGAGVRLGTGVCPGAGLEVKAETGPGAGMEVKVGQGSKRARTDATTGGSMGACADAVALAPAPAKTGAGTDTGVRAGAGAGCKRPRVDGEGRAEAEAPTRVVAQRCADRTHLHMQPSSSSQQDAMQLAAAGELQQLRQRQVQVQQQLLLLGVQQLQQLRQQQQQQLGPHVLLVTQQLHLVQPQQVAQQQHLAQPWQAFMAALTGGGLAQSGPLLRLAP